MEKKLEKHLFNSIHMLTTIDFNDVNIVPYLMRRIQNLYDEVEFDDPKVAYDILLNLTLYIYFIEKNTPRNLLRAKLTLEIFSIITRYTK